MRVFRTLEYVLIRRRPSARKGESSAGWTPEGGPLGPPDDPRRVLASTMIPADAAASASHARLVVDTDRGLIRGSVVGGMTEFLGVPYAAAPVGDLRWRPPQPHARWGGVRDATSFGAHCPQGPSPFGIASTTEDCLFLNVFAPARRDDESGHHLPVMLWIHGGALVVGESNDYDPSLLVARGV